MIDLQNPSIPSDHYVQPKPLKTHLLLQTTKKFDCPARLIMKEVIFFPDDRVSIHCIVICGFSLLFSELYNFNVKTARRQPQKTTKTIEKTTFVHFRHWSHRNTFMPEEYKEFHQIRFLNFSFCADFLIILCHKNSIFRDCAKVLPLKVREIQKLIKYAPIEVFAFL